MTIDAQGRAHKPAGSPASAGGQFAAQAAPGAAALLEMPAQARVRAPLDTSVQLRELLHDEHRYTSEIADEFADLYVGDEHRATARSAVIRHVHDNEHYRKQADGTLRFDPDAAAHAILADIDAAGTAPEPVLTSREYAPEYRMDGYGPDDWSDQVSNLSRGFGCSEEFGDWLAMQSETDRARLFELTAAAEAASGNGYTEYGARWAEVTEHVTAMRDAELVPPPVGSGGTASEGYMGGSAYTGANASMNLPMAEAGRKIRADMARAAKMGYLPANAKVRVVQAGSGAGWYAEIKGIPRDLATEPDYGRENSYGREVSVRVAAIARQFEQSDRNSMYDYSQSYRGAVVQWRFDD